MSKPIDDYVRLPLDLPIPQDDGACLHLPGQTLPSTLLRATDGQLVDLRAQRGWVVLYCYPMTARPGVALPKGWDAIPGARGCTPQSCGFRDHHTVLSQLGAKVYGLSTQDTVYQQEAAARLHLPFALLSDADQRFSDALGLPMFEVADLRLNQRLTLMVFDGSIRHCFYPVFPPDRHAESVVAWLQQA